MSQNSFLDSLLVPFAPLADPLEASLIKDIFLVILLAPPADSSIFFVTKLLES